MKKLMGFVLAVLLLAGCSSYNAYQDYYTNPADYSEIWALSGFYRGDTDRSPLFPESLDGLNVITFFCRYDQQLPLGEGVQLLLEIQYDDPLVFDREVDRLMGLTFSCPDVFDNLEGYALRLGENLASEFCLVDREKQIVSYVYLKNIPREQVKFDHRYIPEGYEGYGEVERT